MFSTVLPLFVAAVATFVASEERNCRIAAGTFLLDLRAFAHQVGIVFQRKAFSHEFKLLGVGLEAFAGGITISDEAYRLFVRDILRGFARHGMKNLIIVNGHGGNTAALNAMAEEVGRSEKVRTLVVNWWTFCGDLTLKVFGEDGGHAGWNETAMVQATHPQLVRKELYSDKLATPRATPGSWTAFPFPSSIILYQPKQGYVKFDEAKAKEYFNSCSDKIGGLGREVIEKWDLAGLYAK